MGDERLDVLARILEIVAGPADVTEIGRYMRSDVVVNMDGVAFRGLSGWQKWMRYSHACSGLEDVSLEITGAEDDGERLRVAVVGRGRRDGRDVTSEPVWITYRFDGVKVAETWTSRRNYVFFFGDGIRSRLGFAWLMLRIVVWCAWQDLRAGSQPTTGVAADDGIEVYPNEESRE